MTQLSSINPVILSLFLMVIAYFLGTFPSGIVVVRLLSGKDVRDVGSGRTGGTNSMRAAGFWAGFTTAWLDIFKSMAAILLAKAVLPDVTWAHWVTVLAGILAIIGHNYNVFLRYETTLPDGRIVKRFGGGAGGACAFGGALALSGWIAFIIFFVGLLVFFGIGYASVTTMFIAITATIILVFQANAGVVPWTYVFYGVLSMAVLAWSLRPNFKKLREGRERLVGIRSWLKYGKLTYDPNATENQ